MPISKETKERIASEGADYYTGPNLQYSAFDKRNRVIAAYIAGAEAEAGKAQGLIETIEKIKDITGGPVMPSFTLLKQLHKVATEALANYNSKPVK